MSTLKIYWNKVSNLGVHSTLEQATIVKLRLINKVMVLSIVGACLTLFIKSLTFLSLLVIVLHSVGLYISSKEKSVVSTNYFVAASLIILMVGVIIMEQASSFYIFIFPLLTLIYFILNSPKIQTLYNVLFLLGGVGVIGYSFKWDFLGITASKEISNVLIILLSILVQIGILVIFKKLVDFKDQVLLEKQASLEEAQRVAQIGSWEYNYLEDKLTWSNQFYKMIGIPVGASINFEKDFLPILPADYQLILKAAKNERNINKYFNFSFSYEREGKTEWFHIIGRKMFNADKKAVKLYGTLQDVTEQIQKDDEVLLASSFAEAALEATADGILVESMNNKIERFNKKFTDMWRIKPKSLVNKTREAIYDLLKNQLLNPEDFEETIQELENNPKVTSLDTLKFKDGRTFERYSYPQVVENEEVGRVWSFRDITDQTRAEGALKNSEATLRSIIESTTDRIYAINKNYRLIAFNKIFENAYREVFEEDLYIGMNMTHNTMVNTHRTYYDRALKGENFFHEHQSKNGAESITYFMTSYNPIRNQEEEVIGCTVFSKDITEQKKAQRALKASEARMRSVFDSTTDEIYAIDKDYRLIAFNKTSAKKSKRLNGTELQLNNNILNTGNGKSWKLSLERALKGKTFTEEHHLKPNAFFEAYFLNSYAPIKDQYGRVIGCTVFSKDITTLKKTEKAITENQQRFNSIFHNKRIGIATLNKGNKIQEINTTFCEILGYEAQELGQTHFEDLMLPIDRKAFQHGFSKVLNKQISSFDIETRFNRSDGSVVYVQTNISGIYDTKGQFYASTATIIDLSESIKQEKKIKDLIKDLKNQSAILRASNFELNQSTKELEQFAYIASHDLQEPLRMIGNFVELLGDEYKDTFDEDGHIYMKYIVNGVSRMSALIEAILQFSRIGKKTPNYRKTKIEDLVKKSLEKLDEKTLNAKINLENLDIELVIESNHLGLVFFNLIDNALKFNTNKTPVITIAAKERQKDWLFSIEDNGIGIDIKYQNKVFEIFKRLHRKEEYEGTGIGLALCKRIVHRHKGQIWYNSNLGKGSTFYFSVNKNLENE